MAKSRGTRRGGRAGYKLFLLPSWFSSASLSEALQLPPRAATVTANSRSPAQIPYHFHHFTTLRVPSDCLGRQPSGLGCEVRRVTMTAFLLMRLGHRGARSPATPPL
ncbi:hypothetical protein LZ32DRAFT_402273 [Colletotrichum eremochloae]|nr:hypothetical protein LZ32DRAFT_402273 [Colletotrichum eremochloae]